MKYLKLSNSSSLVKLDDEDYDRLPGYLWSLGKGNIYNSRFNLILCRFILGITDISLQPDHIDRDIFNCQKENLRVCTKQQNCFNRGKGEYLKKPSSKYKGIYWMKNRKCWAVRIYVNGQRLSLKTYKSEIKAAEAYNEAVKKYYGEFGYLNKIDKKERINKSI